MGSQDTNVSLRLWTCWFWASGSSHTDACSLETRKIKPENIHRYSLAVSSLKFNNETKYMF